VDEPEVRRVLAWYDKNTECLVGEVELEGIGVDDLRRIFGVSPEKSIDPRMFDCYSVEERHAAQLQKFVRVDIDPSHFDFFVEATQYSG